MIYLHQIQDLDYEFSCLIVMLVHAWLTILSVLNLGKKDVRFVLTRHILKRGGGNQLNYRIGVMLHGAVDFGLLCS
jgi:hypothetical protein